MAKGLGELEGRAHVRVEEAETDVSVLKRSVAGLRSLCVTLTESMDSSSGHRKVTKMWKQPPLGSHLERTPCYSTGDASREWKQALVTFKELSEGAVHHDWADGSRRQPVTVCSQGSKGDECWYSAHFFLLIQSKALARGMVRPMLGQVFFARLELPGNTLKEKPRGEFQR